MGIFFTFKDASPQDIVLVSRLKGGICLPSMSLFKYYPCLCTSAYFFLEEWAGSPRTWSRASFLDIWDKHCMYISMTTLKGYLFLAIKAQVYQLPGRSQKVQDRNRKGYAACWKMPGCLMEKEVRIITISLRVALRKCLNRKKTAIQLVCPGKRYQDARRYAYQHQNSLKTHLEDRFKVLKRRN